MKLPVQYVEFSAQGVVTLQDDEISTDNLAPWGVVVQNEATLISAGTELSGLFGVESSATYPSRTGYAAIGRLIARGEAVNDFAIGDRVFYAGSHASAQRFLHGQNHQWGRLYPVPDGIASEDAVFVCLAEIAMTAPNVTTLDIGDTVAVFGLGLIGNLACQLYQIQGANVMALSRSASRCELARSVGIATTLNVPLDAQVAAVQELTNGKGAEVTVEAAGQSALIENCVAATALFGQVILLGTPRAPYTANLTNLLRPIHERGLVMRSAHIWQFPPMEIREVKQTVSWAYRTLFELIQSGRLQVAPLRSHFVKPEEAPRVYDGLQNDRDHYWGVVFDWRE